MKSVFRPLTAEELEVVSGGNIIVNMPRGGGGVGGGGGFGGGIFGGGGGYETTPEPDYGGDPGPEIVVTAPSEPDKCEANPVQVTFGSMAYSQYEGAPYYLPESIDDQYLIKLWNKAIDLANNGDIYQKITEFLRMYQDRNYEFHADFKDYDADNISYYSSVTGEIVETSPFEAFGNYFYGVLMNAAGFSLFQTQVIAAAVQNLSGGADLAETVQKAIDNIISGSFEDDPIDAPHVLLGWNSAAQYFARGADAVRFVLIIPDGCSASGSGTSNAPPPNGSGSSGFEPTYPSFGGIGSGGDPSHGEVR